MSKNILIGVPCMNQVPAGFCSSLARLRKIDNCVLNMQCGSLVYDSRNKIAKIALQTKADFILWLDSDMLFDPDILERLMADIEKGRDIVSGLYYRRAHPFTPVAFSELDINPDDDTATFKNYTGPFTGVNEVAGVGFGCVLMKTDVIFDCFAAYNTCFSPMAHMGEDLAFCWRARQQGYKIFLDADIKCGHIGQYIITEDFYKNYAEGGADDAVN